MTGAPERSVAIAGLGAIGAQVARALDRGIAGLRLIAVAANNHERAQALVAGFASPPRIVGLAALAEADIVVEAVPAALFVQVAKPAIAAGRVLVPCSVGTLLANAGLIEDAGRAGARIVVPTGAIAGLDAVRAMAEAGITSVRLETHKPPYALAATPYLVLNNIRVSETEAMLVFEGNAIEAAKAFPANINVVAALALAGVGPLRTRVSIWSDPGITRNTHKIYAESEVARLAMTVENVVSEVNPKTSKLAGLSVIACLRGLTSSIKIGS